VKELHSQQHQKRFAPAAVSSERTVSGPRSQFVLRSSHHRHEELDRLLIIPFVDCHLRHVIHDPQLEGSRAYREGGFACSRNYRAGIVSLTKRRDSLCLHSKQFGEAPVLLRILNVASRKLTEFERSFSRSEDERVAHGRARNGEQKGTLPTGSFLDEELASDDARQPI
jgi:hypothetical protein